MKSEQRQALVILFALTALMLGFLAIGYQHFSANVPPRAVSVLVPVRFIDVDDAFLETIGVSFEMPPVPEGSSQ